MSEDIEELDDAVRPQTGVPAIDEALAALDLGGDVAGHPQEFATAVDALQAVLRGPGVR